MWVQLVAVWQKISSKAAHMSYVRLAILYGSESLCLKESDMEIVCMKERSVVTAMCGVQLKDRQIYRLDVHVGFE